MSLGLIAFSKGHIDVAILAVILSGSCIGFLWHNFNPAQIFMGDTGALFIGSVIGGISAVGAIKGPATMTIAVPVVILGVAVVDTALAILRRIENNVSIGEGDYDHFHYWLVKHGLTVRQAVGIIYALTIALSVVAYFISSQKSTPAGWFIAFGAFAVLIIAGAMVGMIKLGRLGRWIKERRKS
jgi:UDP-GlcNAc:undecaprenyl-phosphate GlcNAc-1-phosphate transferase